MKWKELEEIVLDMFPEVGPERVDRVVQGKVREGRREGVEAGMLYAGRELLLELLEARFAPVPSSIENRIRGEEHLPVLRSLVNDAATSRSLQDFGKVLEGAAGRRRGIGEGAPEVVRVTRDGVWLRVGDVERLLSFDLPPYSKFWEASVEAVLQVERPFPDEIHWPKAGVKLSIMN